RRMTSSSVSRHAARIGSAPFLFPAGATVPDNGTPPSITNFSIGACREVDLARASPSVAGEGLARVTAMQVQISREEALNLLCEWTQSESLRRHMLAV